MVACTDNCESHGHYTVSTSTRFGRKLTTGCPKCAAAVVLAHHSDCVLQNRYTIEPGGLPERYCNVTFGSLTLTSQDELRFARRLENYISHYQQSVASCAFIALLGSYDFTPMACAMLIAAGNRNLSAKYTTAQDYILAIRACYGHDHKITEEDVLSHYSEPKLLVLDGMGLTRNTLDERLLLTTLLEKRYSETRPTVLVLKGDSYALSQRLSEDVYAKIVSQGKIINCSPWEGPAVNRSV